MGLFQKKEVALPPSLKSIEERPLLRIIRFKGSLDIGAVIQIQAWIPNFRNQKSFSFKNLLMDFQDVPYADSSAVSQLVKTMFDYKKANHRVGIINLQEGPRNIVEILKVDKLLRIYPTEDEAVRDLEG